MLARLSIPFEWTDYQTYEKQILSMYRIRFCAKSTKIQMLSALQTLCINTLENIYKYQWYLNVVHIASETSARVCVCVCCTRQQIKKYTVKLRHTLYCDRFIQMLTGSMEFYLKVYLSMGNRFVCMFLTSIQIENDGCAHFYLLNICSHSRWSSFASIAYHYAVYGLLRVFFSVVSLFSLRSFSLVYLHHRNVLFMYLQFQSIITQWNAFCLLCSFAHSCSFVRHAFYSFLFYMT